MPDTAFGWKSEAQFLASMKAKSILPQKVIHVDDAGPSHVSELTAGGLYVADSITRQAVIAKEPRMCCPHCGQLVSGLAGAKPQYEIPQTHAPCLPLGDNTVEPPRMLYSLEPCGCKASQEWAAAFSAELNRRMEGGEPRPIIDMTEKERQARKMQLEKRISKLYSAQASATMQEHKDAIQYRLVILTDQLMRLIPGEHNKVPAVKLNPKVEQWATTKGYHKPPASVEVQPLEAKAASQFLGAIETLNESLFIGNTSVEELVTIFGADKFQLPKQWLTHLLNSIAVNKLLFTEVIKKITGSNNLADVATRGVFIEKNLRNHRDKGETLAPLTVQFLAIVCKAMVNLGPVVVDGPAQKPEAGADQPPVQTEEQFHDQFKRKRRRIRKVED